MSAMVETAVDYKTFFEDTVRQLFECKTMLATTNEQLADTREKLEQTQSEFDEYRADMQIVVIGESVAIVALVIVVVYLALRQSRSV